MQCKREAATSVKAHVDPSKQPPKWSQPIRGGDSINTHHIMCLLHAYQVVVLGSDEWPKVSKALGQTLREMDPAAVPLAKTLHVLTLAMYDCHTQNCTLPIYKQQQKELQS